MSPLHQLQGNMFPKNSNAIDRYFHLNKNLLTETGTFDKAPEF